MVPTGYIQCIVLKDDCKIFDDTRYLRPSKGDTIYLPEYNAFIEEEAGVVEVVEE